MCGILAMVRFDGEPVDHDVLVRMRDSMVHRGPDDSAIWLEGPVGLAHRRLSIVDLSPAGRQPMCNEDGTVWLLFNGEIYNYVELTAELKGRGHIFSSHTDSEVILHLYEEHGARCVDRLNGMFAFAIWDARSRTLFGARDRLGIKPFHYQLRDDRFVCASEAKAILEDSAAAPDLEGLADLLYCGFMSEGRTAFAGIRQLEPGQTITVRDGSATVRTYWDVEYDYRQGRSDAAVEGELADLLADAVRIHCRSDAPLGCHLSGGLDSSTVVGLAARYRTPLPTFTIRFDGDRYYDETRYARAMARHVGAGYHEDTPGPDDFFGSLAGLVWHMETPLPNSGAFAYYTGSRLAARHVKVSLTGHGGDEIFGGYPAQFQVAFGRTDMFGAGAPAASRPGLLRRLAGLRRRGLPGVLSAAGRRLMPQAATSPEELWADLHCSMLPSENPLLHPSFRARMQDHDVRAAYIAPFRSAPTHELFDRCLYHDLRAYLPGLLHLEDRASMKVSLESRVPLLDYRIVEFLATVPPRQKVPGLAPKGLLRRAARGWLPDEVRLRTEKAPFPVPMDSWLTAPPAGLVEAVLRSEACLDRQILAPDVLRSTRLDARTAWLAFNLELWFRIFMDGVAPGEIAVHGLTGALSA